MKTYALEPLSSRHEAELTLDSILPRENNTWLLKDTAGDVIAYCHIAESETYEAALAIYADVSGRHYYKDAEVTSVLQKISANTGGQIACYP